MNLLNSWLLLLLLFTVMPTIEKLLNTDWKEKLLDKSAVGAGQLKGQRLQHTLWYQLMIFLTDFSKCVCVIFFTFLTRN